MGNILSGLVLPGAVRAGHAALYCRGDVRIGGPGLGVPPGGRLGFDTYFNAFFYPKYRTYTGVTEIRLRLRLEGRARIRFLCRSGEDKLLFEERCEGEYRSPVVRLAELPAEGMLWFELRAEEEEGFRLLAGQYETEEAPLNRVKVAAVICTYRREACVLENLAQLRRTVWEAPASPIRDALDVFVVDNGRTLELPEEPHVRLFANRNWGGSGGFARGLLEALERKDSYTHVLFMDDDIAFETETLVKTVQLLRYARAQERPLCIGGQMLREDKPTVQHECGAYYRGGKLVPVGKKLDLAKAGNLLLNEREHPIQYNAWWYCCIPLDAAEEAGLPLPLFIKTDDVEYGLRLKPRILLMNGIGVWHTNFEGKYSPYLEYYIKRNELLVSALHGIGAGIWPGMKKLGYSTGWAALRGDPRAIGFMLRGYRDFLKGPDFFLEMDAEALNGQLLREMEKPGKSRPVCILTDPFRVLAMMGRLALRYRGARAQYLARAGELSCRAFWTRSLGL